MTNVELKKFQIIKALHMIVKCANNEELANADGLYIGGVVYKGDDYYKNFD